MWDNGRQNSGYFKKKLFESALLKCDFYILKIPAGVGVPCHIDAAPPGYVHWRINLEISPVFKKTGVTVPLTKSRLTVFKASHVPHSYEPGTANAYFLSFGFLQKERF